MNKNKQGRLIELKKSNFEVVKGDPDIRGWKVKNLEGKRIGHVDELILDTANRKVRYMVVDLDKNDFKLDDKKVLVPIGLAEIHRDDDDVILPHVQVSQIANIPEYDREHLDGNVERQVCYALGMTKEQSHVEGMEPEPEFYTHDYYNDDNLYRHRLKETSEKRKLSEYEKGLRLWEKRSEGGIIAETSGDETGHTSRTDVESRQEKDSLQPVRRERKPVSRPQNKRDRASGGRIDIRPGKSIGDRIRNEGLRDHDEGRRGDGGER
jgi:sporulation protein YlmC with PRC-barrel domain